MKDEIIIVRLKAHPEKFNSVSTSIHTIGCNITVGKSFLRNSSRNIKAHRKQVDRMSTTGQFLCVFKM